MFALPTCQYKSSIKGAIIIIFKSLEIVPPYFHLLLIMGSHALMLK